ncbi:MAG: ABC transporter substrate-binding protein, partial [Stellaceae bacterium]
ANWTLAESDGCYRRNGLAVAIDPGHGSGDALSKVAAGAYDIAIADFMSLLAFDAHPRAPQLVATYIMIDRAPTSIVALKKSGIAGPRDLAGKRIGDNVGEASRELFPAFAAANGIDAKSVSWVNVAPNLREASLLRGAFDAAAGHMYTITSGLRAIGVADTDMVVMPYAEHGVDLFGNSVIVKASWAPAHAAALKAFLVCAVDGMKGAIADPKTAIQSLAPHNSMLDARQAEAELEFSLLGLDAERQGEWPERRRSRAAQPHARALRYDLSRSEADGRRGLDGCISPAQGRADGEPLTRHAC